MVRRSPELLTRLRKVLLALPETSEVEAWGEPTFRVKGRIFCFYADASTHHGFGRTSAWFKAAPGDQELLVAADPDRYFVPPYVGPKGWVGVRIDRRVSWRMVARMAEDSWRLTAPKTLLKRLAPVLLAMLMPAMLAAQSARDVVIRSFDGTALAATFYEGGGRGPAAIIFRNCDAGRASVDGFARRLAARGIHVVTWDYRAGQSAARGWSGTRDGDADAVLGWLATRADVDTMRLASVGGSCGVALALSFARRHQSATAAVVILSGPSDVEEKRFIAAAARVAVFGAASRVEGAAVPYIDSVVSVSHHPRSRLVVLEVGGHGTGMLADGRALRDTVVAWLARELGAPR